MKRDKANPAYVNEVWRRWERRRMLPFRQFDAAVMGLMVALRQSAVGRVVQDAWVRPAKRLAQRLRTR